MLTRLVIIRQEPAAAHRLCAWCAHKRLHGGGVPWVWRRLLTGRDMGLLWQEVWQDASYHIRRAALLHLHACTERAAGSQDLEGVFRQAGVHALRHTACMHVQAQQT